MVTDHLMNRIGAESILPFKRSVTIVIYTNLDGNGNTDSMCKQTLIVGP